MPSPRRNLELKFRCADLAAVADRATELGATDAGLLQQRDTFFPAPEARLKLRVLGPGRAELIAYRRPDHPGARGSDYLVCPTAEPELLAATLAHALGTDGVVEKRRHLLVLRHTRIHLDEVTDLGTFVELETVLEGQPEPAALAELTEIAAALGLAPEDRIALPYLELLRQGGQVRGGAR